MENIHGNLVLYELRLFFQLKTSTRYAGRQIHKQVHLDGRVLSRNCAGATHENQSQLRDNDDEVNDLF